MSDDKTKKKVLVDKLNYLYKMELSQMVMRHIYSVVT